jgi:hypothetical protein
MRKDGHDIANNRFSQSCARALKPLRIITDICRFWWAHSHVIEESSLLECNATLRTRLSTFRGNVLTSVFKKPRRSSFARRLHLPSDAQSPPRRPESSITDQLSTKLKSNFIKLLMNVHGAKHRHTTHRVTTDMRGKNIYYVGAHISFMVWE